LIVPRLDADDPTLSTIEAQANLIARRFTVFWSRIASVPQMSEVKSKQSDELFLATRVLLPMKLDIDGILVETNPSMMVPLIVVPKHPPTHQRADRSRVHSFDEFIR